MNGKDLTQGSILGNIMTFSLPYMLAYFLQILYGLADLYVIGQYCDVDSTTAVSNGAQVMYMVTVVLIGLAMGTTVLTARAVGAKDTEGTYHCRQHDNHVCYHCHRADGCAAMFERMDRGRDGHAGRGSRWHEALSHGVFYRHTIHYRL